MTEAERRNEGLGQGGSGLLGNQEQVEGVRGGPPSVTGDDPGASGNIALDSLPPPSGDPVDLDALRAEHDAEDTANLEAVRAELATMNAGEATDQSSSVSDLNLPAPTDEAVDTDPAADPGSEPEIDVDAETVEGVRGGPASVTGDDPGASGNIALDSLPPPSGDPVDLDALRAEHDAEDTANLEAVRAELATMNAGEATYQSSSVSDLNLPAPTDEAVDIDPAADPGSEPEIDVDAEASQEAGPMDEDLSGADEGDVYGEDDAVADSEGTVEAYDDGGRE